jgi:alpha-ribazole phosphatase
MEVYLIRHTTPEVPKGMIYGRTDVGLTEHFDSEKKAILQKLPEEIERVYASPSRRCTLLAEGISRFYSTDPRLYEVNFGLWEGKTWDTVKQSELNTWMQDFVHAAPPEGESMIEMQARVLSFWQELQQKPYQKVAIVTHGGVIRLLLANTGNTPLESAFDIKVAYGEVFLVKTAQEAEESFLKL